MRKHYYYIDYLRFFAMIGVVYLHIASILLNGNRIAFGSIDWELLNFSSALHILRWRCSS